MKRQRILLAALAMFLAGFLGLVTFASAGTTTFGTGDDTNKSLDQSNVDRTTILQPAVLTTASSGDTLGAIVPVKVLEAAITKDLDTSALGIAEIKALDMAKAGDDAGGKELMVSKAGDFEKGGVAAGTTAKDLEGDIVATATPAPHGLIVEKKLL